jgi:hypothetical protein
LLSRCQAPSRFWVLWNFDSRKNQVWRQDHAGAKQMPWQTNNMQWICEPRLTSDLGVSELLGAIYSDRRS